MNDSHLWTLLEAADPAADVSPTEAETEARFVSLFERRDTMGTTFQHPATLTPTPPPPTRRRALWVGALAFVLVIAGVGVVWLIRDPGSDERSPASEAPPVTEVTEPPATGVTPPPASVTPTTSPPDDQVGDSLDLTAPWMTGEVFAPDPGARAVETRSVASNGERAVIVGSMLTPESTSWAAVWTSDDGRTWSRVPHDPELFGPMADAWTWMRAVTYTESGFVAIGTNELNEWISWVSPDGIDWQRSEPIGTEEVWLDSIASTGSTVVAVGGIVERAEPFILMSNDGLNWTQTPAPPGMGLTYEGPQASVVSTSDGFRIVANGVWRSVDGLEWFQLTGESPPLFMDEPAAAGPLGVVAISGMGRAVSLLVDDAEWSTTYLGSGVDWDYDDAPFEAGVEPVTMDGIVALDETFIALGTDYLNWNPDEGGNVAVAYRSADGITWHRMDVELHGGRNGALVDAVRIGDLLVGVGSTTDDDGVYGATWILEGGSSGE